LSKDGKVGAFYEKALCRRVLVRRCRDCDERARWRFICSAIFQRGIFAFVSKNIGVDEGSVCVRLDLLLH
jgi:hypothetical protein